MNLRVTSGRTLNLRALAHQYGTLQRLQSRDSPVSEGFGSSSRVITNSFHALSGRRLTLYCRMVAARLPQHHAGLTSFIEAVTVALADPAAHITAVPSLSPA